MQLSSTLRLLYAARAVRGFGDGFAIILLPAYLSAIGYDPVWIGVVATLSLFGTSLLTLGVGFIAPRYDLRSLLMAGGAMTVFTGLAFPQFEQIAFVGLVAFFGTINPSGSDVGVVVPLEHSTLAENAEPRERTSVFARYSLTGALSMATGSLAAALPDFLEPLGIDRIVAFRSMFYAYAALGVAGIMLYRQLPPMHLHAPKETAPLGPSRGVVYKLAALFSLDAFAGGFVVQSLLALWLFERFDLSLAAASLFFFWAGVFSAFSYPVAAWIARRIGLINTMVYTHIPSSVFLILAAFSTNLYVALALLLARSALSQMDVPTRTSYVMAVVTPEERTAAASVTAVPRSLAASISPAMAGALLSLPFSGWPLVICGGLKIAYDVALLFTFRHIRPPEERDP